MSYSHFIQSRLIRRVGLGLVVAAVAAPSVAASALPSIGVDSDGNLVPKSPPMSYVLPQVEVNADGFLNAKPTFQPNFPIPDGSWYTAADAPQFPPASINWDRPEAAAPATPSSTPAFDYRDAGMGAAIALGAALLAIAGVLALRRTRRSAPLA
jgi:hypothetical protein